MYVAWSINVAEAATNAKNNAANSRNRLSKASASEDVTGVPMCTAAMCFDMEVFDLQDRQAGTRPQSGTSLDQMYTSVSQESTI